MNHRVIFRSVGTVLCIEAACMPYLLVAYLSGSSSVSFAISILFYQRQDSHY